MNVRPCICVIGTVESCEEFSWVDKESGEIKRRENSRILKVSAGGRSVRIDFDWFDEIGEPTRMAQASEDGTLRPGTFVQVAVRPATSERSRYVNMQGLAAIALEDASASQLHALG